MDAKNERAACEPHEDADAARTTTAEVYVRGRSTGEEADPGMKTEREGESRWRGRVYRVAGEEAKRKARRTAPMRAYSARQSMVAVPE